MLPKRILKFAPLEVPATQDVQERTYTVTLSDGGVDRHGDTVAVDGWDLEAFKSNPVLLWAHNSSLPPIGTVKNLRVEDGKLRGELKFSDVNPFAQQLKAQVDAGEIGTVSVGFAPKELEVAEDRDDGQSWMPPLNFLKQELLELSLVPVPANPRAVIDRKAAERDPELAAWVQKLRQPKPVELTNEQIAEQVRSAVQERVSALRLKRTGKLD
jgi:HK97 family phage prohead protease